MKFSLKFLLAITLLLVLSVNGFNNLRQAKKIAMESEQLRAAIDTELNTSRFFDDKKQVYTRAFAAFEKRRNKLSNAHKRFESVAVAHRKLHSELVHIFTVRDNAHMGFGGGSKTFRVCLPESPAFELCLGFHKTEKSGSVTSPPRMRDSYYFSPKEQFTFPLPSGDSIVKLLLPVAVRGFPNKSLKVEVNGVEVHATSRDAVLSRQDVFDRKYRDMHSHLHSRFQSGKIPSFEPGPITLVTMNQWPTKHEPESCSIVLRPVEQEPKRD